MIIRHHRGGGYLRARDYILAFVVALAIAGAIIWLAYYLA